jgi:hypothetical protein
MTWFCLGGCWAETESVGFSLLYGSTRKETGLSTPVAVFLGRWPWLTCAGKCLWGSLWLLVCGAFVFSGDYGRRPHYVRVEYMTGRERRDGPSAFDGLFHLCFYMYCTCCIMVPLMKYLIGYLLYLVSVFY